MNLAGTVMGNKDSVDTKAPEVGESALLLGVHRITAGAL